MNEMQVFRNPEFGSVRTIEGDGKVLFCASDVAKALGYARPNDAIVSHCRYTAKHRIPIRPSNGVRKCTPSAESASQSTHLELCA